MSEYMVVINFEEQYSIWPFGRDIPDGWQAEGFAGEKDMCLAHIETVWLDITPLSTRVNREKPES